MGLEACCFPNDDCLELSLDECLRAGGQPIGEGTTCGAHDPDDPLGPGIGSCDRWACCRQWAGQWSCDDGPAAVCEGIGGAVIGRHIMCRHVLAAGGCELPGSIPQDCCMLDGGRLQAVRPEHCIAARGEPVGPADPCLPHVDEECRFPQADEEVGPVWTLELCAGVALLPAIAGAGLEAHREGYGVLATARDVRNDWRRGCEPALTTVYLDGRVYGSAVFCSEQLRFPGGPRAHDGTVAIQQAECPEPVSRAGYGVFVSGYSAPDWIETILGSRLIRCWGPENR